MRALSNHVVRATCGDRRPTFTRMAGTAAVHRAGGRTGQLTSERVKCRHRAESPSIRYAAPR